MILPLVSLLVSVVSGTETRSFEQCLALIKTSPIAETGIQVVQTLPAILVAEVHVSSKEQFEYLRNLSCISHVEINGIVSGGGVAGVTN
jgi:3-dehydroquinate dehydratase